MNNEQISEHLENKDLALSWERIEKGSGCEFRAPYGSGIILVNLSPNQALNQQGNVLMQVRYQREGTAVASRAARGVVPSFDDHAKAMIGEGIQIAKGWADSNPESPEDREKTTKLVCDEVGKYLAR